MIGDNSFSGIEDLFNQLAGGMDRSNRKFDTSNEADKFLLSSIDGRKELVLTFDFSGKKVNSVEIKEGSEFDEYGERVYTGNKVIEIIYDGSSVLNYSLPNNFKKRELNHTFTNGILEVVLKK